MVAHNVGKKMPTDRQLIEAAAKAAGVSLKLELLQNEGRPWLGWNPLEDDGEALRLAVELNLHVWISNPLTYAGLDGDLRTAESHFDNEDRFSATRRAIVRAAAAMAT